MLGRARSPDRLGPALWLRSRSGVGPSVKIFLEISFSAAGQGVGVVRVDRQRPVEQAPRLFDLARFAGFLKPPAQSPTLHGQINGVRIVGASALFRFCVRQSPAETVDQSRHDLILQLEEVGHVLLEAVGPKVCPGLGVDELRVHAHPVLVALHGAFENVANAELLADLLGVDALAFESESGIAGDDETALDPRKFSREVLRDAVGEIVLRRIAGEIGERQHDEREMRGFCRFRRSSIEDVPPACDGQKEKGGDGGRERGEGRASFGADFA